MKVLDNLVLSNTYGCQERARLEVLNDNDMRNDNQ